MFFLLSLFLGLGHAADICQTQYTMAHYAYSECLSIPVDSLAGEFRIKAVLLSKSKESVALQKTMIIVPGGPGESAEPLMTALQEKEMLNAMWSKLNLNVVLYDPRGTGDSLLPLPTTSYDGRILSSQLMAEDLYRVIQYVSPQKPVVLFAHSAGGQSVMRVAESHPSRVSHIVLSGASTNSRQMAEVNLILQSWQPLFWQKFVLENVPENQRAEWLKLYDDVEFVIKQQTKARAIGQHIHPQLRPISVLRFRQMMLTHINKDPSGESFYTLLKSYQAAFVEMNLESPLTPPVLVDFHFNKDDFKDFKFDTKTWIQRQILCGEGFTFNELHSPIYFDGLTFHDYFCYGLYNENEVFYEPDQSKIQMPLIYFAGGQDANVPLFVAHEVVARIPQAQWVYSEDAGHLFFVDKPYEMFTALEDFLK